MKLFFLKHLRILLVALLVVSVGSSLSYEASAQTTCIRATNRVVKGKVTTSLSKTTRTGNYRRGGGCCCNGSDWSNWGYRH